MHIVSAWFNNIYVCRDYQIIIFENEEPTKELKSSINYIHFSGNANVDRKGFIPE